MLKPVIIFLRSFPLQIIWWKLLCKFLNKKIPDVKTWQNLFVNKSGIEIGGPSALFQDGGFLPLYSKIQMLDDVNFSTTTIWKNNIAEGNSIGVKNKSGYQYIAEGTHLPFAENNQYDFVISCNNLEHIANPILAVKEWQRILKPSGILLIVVPNKEANFDHHRPYTSISHIIGDFESKVNELDMTHLEEILAMHDLSRDPQARPFKKFKERCLNNIENRCMHHHVFNDQVLKELITYCQMEVLKQYTSPTDYYILAKKI